MKLKEGERGTIGARSTKRACVDCTKRCSSIHGRSNFASDSASASFFKVMLADFTQSLYMPPSFAKTIANLVGTNISVEDSTGASWIVRICKKNKSLAFGTGWCKFVQDHSISVGEFLVFKQTEKTVFSVQIFSTSGSERVHFCEAKKSPNPNKRKREKTSKPLKTLDTEEWSNPDKRKREKSSKPLKTVTTEKMPNPNERKRESTSKRPKNLATGNKRLKDHTPTIQEVTRKEEKKERRTRSALRRLIMEDLQDKDLLVKEGIPVIPPILALPSYGKCLCVNDCSVTETSGKGCEETMNIVSVGTEGEKNVTNINMSDNEKGKNVGGDKNETNTDISEHEMGKNVDCEKNEANIDISDHEMGKNVEGIKHETNIDISDNEKGKNVEGEKNEANIDISDNEKGKKGVKNETNIGISDNEKGKYVEGEKNKTKMGISDNEKGNNVDGVKNWTNTDISDIEKGKNVEGDKNETNIGISDNEKGRNVNGIKNETHIDVTDNEKGKNVEGAKNEASTYIGDNENGKHLEGEMDIECENISQNAASEANMGF